MSQWLTCSKPRYIAQFHTGDFYGTLVDNPSGVNNNSLSTRKTYVNWTHFQLAKAMRYQLFVRCIIDIFLNLGKQCDFLWYCLQFWSKLSVRERTWYWITESQLNLEANMSNLCQYCVCWWPSNIKCQDICRHSDGYVPTTFIRKWHQVNIRQEWF